MKREPITIQVPSDKYLHLKRQLGELGVILSKEGDKRQLHQITLEADGPYLKGWASDLASRDRGSRELCEVGIALKRCNVTELQLESTDAPRVAESWGTAIDHSMLNAEEVNHTGRWFPRQFRIWTGECKKPVGEGFLATLRTFSTYPPSRRKLSTAISEGLRERKLLRSRASGHSLDLLDLERLAGEADGPKGEARTNSAWLFACSLPQRVIIEDSIKHGSSLEERSEAAAMLRRLSLKGRQALLAEMVAQVLEER